MSEHDDDRLRVLRETFDRSFAEPYFGTVKRTAPLLEVRVAESPYALDLAEIGAVVAGISPTPVPSDEPALLGVVGVSGELIAVYDLSRVLGHEGSRPPRWLARVRGQPVAFAFDALDGHSQLPPGVLLEPAAEGADALPELVWLSGLSRPLIRLSVLAARLRRRLTPREEAL